MAKVVGYALIVVGAVMNAYTPGSGTYFIYAGQAILVGDAVEQNRKAKSQARAAYNAGLKDRMEMVERDPQQARTIVYGRVRAVEGVRRSWVSGTNSEKLTMIVSFAGHEIDGFEQFYFNEVPVTLDASGYVLTAPYAKGNAVTFTSTVTFNSSGVATATIASNYRPGSVYCLADVNGDGVQDSLTVSIVVHVATITGGPPGGTGTFTYQIGDVTPKARVRTFLGAVGQNVGAALAAEYPGNLTSTDKFAGMALAVVDLEYDQDVFPQGRPNITAVFRGAKCYDPRKDDTAGGSGAHRLADASTWQWTANPALHAFDYARRVNGWNVPAAEINTADIVSAANVCDEVVGFPVS